MIVNHLIYEQLFTNLIFKQFLIGFYFVFVKFQKISNNFLCQKYFQVPQYDGPGPLVETTTESETDEDEKEKEVIRRRKKTKAKENEPKIEGL